MPPRSLQLALIPSTPPKTKPFATKAGLLRQGLAPRRCYGHGPIALPTSNLPPSNARLRLQCPPCTIPNYRPLPTGCRRQSTSSNPSSIPLFSYRIAAAYSGKRNNFNAATHHFTHSQSSNTRYRAGSPVAESIPQAGRLASGQDAVFVTNVGKTAACAFGVADGVGGWQDQGIDSADFAHGICMYMEEAAKYYSGSTMLDPQNLLKTGYERVCNDRSISGGGSTACLGVADGEGKLRVANLGDSGFMQLRLRKVHYYSDPQTHAFNTPYQLSRVPPKMLAQMEEFGAGAPFSDSPGDASVTSHELQHGDVLVFATDGVWDNLSSQDMLGLVSQRMEKMDVWSDRSGAAEVSEKLVEVVEERGDDSAISLQTLLATDIVKTAKSYGQSSRRNGPFAKEFQKKYPMEGYVGGKPDDIAVIVAVAIARSAAHGGSKL